MIDISNNIQVVSFKDEVVEEKQFFTIKRTFTSIYDNDHVIRFTTVFFLKISNIHRIKDPTIVFSPLKILCGLN